MGVANSSWWNSRGSRNDVWVFQTAQDLTVANGAVVTLSGGAQAENIYWQVAARATLGAASQSYETR
jgi:hypothetical protein